MAVVGIDLGTTNTVVAAVREGRATALKDKIGRALLPSVVSFPADGAPLVGHEAKERRSLDPENTVFSIKRLIGRSWESEHVHKALGRFPFTLKEGPGKATLVSCRGADYTLPEVSALVLEEARAIAEARLGETVTDVVITVPANFNDLQRAATKVAARVAGLEVLRILNEPTAAALAYGFGKKGRERIAVYDFGGGTFDVTLLDLSENVFEVLATAGDTFLGGDDLDQAVVELMLEELEKKHKVDASKNQRIREQFRLAAEKLKIDLSTRSMAKARVEDVGHGTLPSRVDFEFSMKRSDFERLADPLVERTLEVCGEALEIAGLEVKDLDQVLLVGGSTRIPLVRRRISSFFGKMPQSRVNPDEVVAIGAAIQATALETRSAQVSVPAPPAPGLDSSPPPEGRSPSGTRTGLAGLRKTIPGTGSEPPPAQVGAARAEGSILASLPKASATRPDSPRARSLAPDAPAEDEPRGPKTLLGVGEPDGEPPKAHAPTVQLTTSRPPVAPLHSPSPVPPPAAGRAGMKTLAGVGPEDADLPSPAARSPLAPPVGRTSPNPLTRLGPSDSKITSTSTLSRLGTTEGSVASGSVLSGLGRVTSSPPPRTDVRSPSSLPPDDFDEVTSIYPARPTPSLAPPGESKLPPAKKLELTVPSDDEEEAYLPAPVGEVGLPAAAPLFPPPEASPATTDGSVVFDFEDLSANEEDQGGSLPLALDDAGVHEEVASELEEDLDLPLPARGVDLPSPTRATAADLPQRRGAADKTPAAAAPRAAPPFENLPLVGAGVRGSGLLTPPREDLSISGIDLEELEAAAEELDLSEQLPRSVPPPPGSSAQRQVDPGLDATRPGYAAPIPAAPREDSVAELWEDELESEEAEEFDFSSSRPPGEPLAPSPDLARTQLGVAPLAPGASPAPRGLSGAPAIVSPLATHSPLSASPSAPQAKAPSAPGLGRTQLGVAPPSPGAAPERAPLESLSSTGGAGAPPLSLRSALSFDATVPGAGGLGASPNPERGDAPRSPLLIDVTPLSLGVEVIGGYVDRLIERNSPIPCERTRTFATARDDQTIVRVRVSQGESTRFDGNTVLGEVELSGLEQGPRGTAKVDVTFSLDESGMLQVTARDPKTGQSANAALRLIGVDA